MFLEFESKFVMTDIETNIFGGCMYFQLVTKC